MRIAIMGPFPPFRGGIANFNVALYQALRKRGHTVKAVNFLTQYPSILFPGKSQFDRTEEPLTGKPVFSSVSPLSWVKTSDRILAFRPEVVIFKYWLPFFAPGFGTVTRRIKKKSNAMIVVICDNIVPHEKRFLDPLLTRYFLKRADRFIVMSRTVQQDLLSFFPQARFTFNPHPLFELFGSPHDQTSARKALNIQAKKVILYFGLIRSYKGVDTLIRAVKILKKKLENFHVLIVGECYGGKEIYTRLVSDLAVEDVTTLKTDFIPNRDVGLYFSSADLVVLPYKSATQSGVVPIAYHFGKPVIVTRVGGLPEIVPHNQAGLVVEGTPEGVAQAIFTYFNENKAGAFKAFISEFKRQFSWDSFAEKLEELTLS